jgi:glycosyltransferase involved in cell wall biosynthesis
MLRISVVIPTYNHGTFVRHALASVLGQTVPASEVIVVDDGSTDDTAAVLRTYDNGRVRVIRQANRGVAAARNAGAATATGDLVAFLDSDDVWMPAKLESQVSRFVAAPELGLVHCGLDEVDGRDRLIRRRLDGMEGWVAEEMLLFRRGVIFGAGSTAMVSSVAFRAVGGFDERLSTAADWDFCYRIARRYPIGFVKEALVRYRLHGLTMHMNVRAMERDMLRGYAKAFSEGDPALRKLRRRAYGKLHSVLAGSYLEVGEYRAGISHAVKSVVWTPGSVGYFAGYPLRRLRRFVAALEAN